MMLLLSGIIMGIYGTLPRKVMQSITASVDDLRDDWTTLTGTKPEHYLQPSRYRGNGVTINKIAQSGAGLVFLSGFFKDTNELRLIRRDGTIVARWPVRFSEIFPAPDDSERSPRTDWNVDIHGALILPDGSIVFNFEFNGLVKLDRCGKVVWTLRRATHHSVERAEGGGYWVPGKRFYAADEDSPFPPFETPFSEDTILRVSENGKVLSELSVPGIFYDNGLEAILTASGHHYRTGMSWDEEIVHLNKVDVLTSDIAADFPMFEAGDLALSIRELNLVMVIDPTDGRVKWRHIGPWLRQHDPEFKAGGKIVVFNNNTYETAFGKSHSTSYPSIPRVSDIMEIDPQTGESDVLYGNRKGQRMLSVWRGKVDLRPNGGLLVTEFEGGRVFETDAAGRVIWQYINRYSPDEVAEITEARAYPESYFNVPSWSCDGLEQ